MKAPRHVTSDVDTVCNMPRQRGIVSDVGIDHGYYGCPGLNNPVTRAQSRHAALLALIAAFRIVKIIIRTSIRSGISTDDEFPRRAVCAEVGQLVDIAYTVVRAIHVNVRDKRLNTDSC